MVTCMSIAIRRTLNGCASSKSYMRPYLGRSRSMIFGTASSTACCRAAVHSGIDERRDLVQVVQVEVDVGLLTDVAVSAAEPVELKRPDELQVGRQQHERFLPAEAAERRTGLLGRLQ
jgi:hypothetical protein